MSPDNTTSKFCPTCGAKIQENATRCSVCGRYFTPSGKPQIEKAVKAPKVASLTLNLPIAIGLLVIILALGAGLAYTLLRGSGRVVEPTPTATATLTPTITVTPTETPTPTPEPTATPLPPIEYAVQLQDTCSLLAAYYKVSVQSIIDMNKLSPNCIIAPGNVLLIPQPTYTLTPAPTTTLSGSQATQVACDKLPYVVKENDTLQAIAANYAVSIEGLKKWNGLTSDIVYLGTTIQIPLCERLPTPGPTPTPTTPPPYPAANLLLPVDGAPYAGSDDSVTLQWASVGTLRQNESYMVTIEDVTEGAGRKLVVYVADTSYIISASFRPLDTTPHVIRWVIEPVRQTGTNAQGLPIWASAGVVSAPRVFTWSGLGIVTPTP